MPEQKPVADTHRVPEPLGEPGDCLYHYTRLSTAIESILPTGTLMMNPFSKMRDPRESKRWGFEAPAESIDTDEESFREEVLLFAEMNRKAEGIQHEVKVLSLTRDDTSPRPPETAIFGSGLVHPRLWEHYAENHHGVCLCFDLGGLIDMLGALRETGRFDHGPVIYRDGEIDLAARQFLLSEARKHGPDKAIRDHVANHVAELFFTKLRDWETEFEYRFTVHGSDPDPVFVSVRHALRAVVIGAATNTNYLPALGELVDRYEIPIFRINWQDAKPFFTNPRALGYW